MTKDPDLREYLAAERTFLAYIRTSLALMGFGFVVARFSIFLREVQLYQHHPAYSPGLSVWFGTAFVLFGAALNGISAVEYRSLVRRLNDMHAANVRPALTPTLTALLVALCGASMSVYLLWLR
jgi:putative membrane protein